MLPGAPPDPLVWLAAATDDEVEATAEVTQPWGSPTRTQIVRLRGLGRVVLQTSLDRSTLARRIRIGRRLPQIAPWLPIPEVLYSRLDRPNFVLVTRYIEGVPASEMLDTKAGARIVARVLGGLVADLGRVPPAAGGPAGIWADPNRLLAAGRRWVGTAFTTIGGLDPIGVETRLQAGLDRLFDAPVVFAHGDLSPVNVLVRGSRAVAVLDFEHARIAPALFDAARVRWVVRHHHPERWPALAEELFAAAAIEPAAATLDQLDLLAVLQCLEALQRTRRSDLAGRRAWACRVQEVLSWDRP